MQTVQAMRAVYVEKSVVLQSVFRALLPLITPTTPHRILSVALPTCKPLPHTRRRAIKAVMMSLNMRAFNSKLPLSYHQA